MNHARLPRSVAYLLAILLVAVAVGAVRGVAQDVVAPEPAEVAPADGVATVSPEHLLERFNDYPHADLISSSTEEVIDYEIGLGAIQKRNGAWRLKHSERLSGQLLTYTWQILDGFTSLEVADELSAMVEREDRSELLFDCKGRACGPGVQWANKIFKQRLLYGQEALQRYRVYAVHNGGEYRLLVYNSARTADRQYLHVELLRVGG